MLRHWHAFLAFALTSSNVTPTKPPLCWGDVNGDGRVNIADAHEIGRYAIGLSVASDARAVAAGDVTGDGRVNVSDAQQVARFSVGLLVGPRLAGCRTSTGQTSD